MDNHHANQNFMPAYYAALVGMERLANQLERSGFPTVDAAYVAARLRQIQERCETVLANNYDE